MDDGTAPGEGSEATKLLARLSVGDQLPWKIDRNGEPQWLVVVEAIGSRSYLVRYPSGRTEILVDAE